MWSDWLVFCDHSFSVSALWCPLATPTILFGFLLHWTWSISSWLLQKVQPLLLTLDERYPLTATPPDFEHGVAPLDPRAATNLGRGVAPLGLLPWPWACDIMVYNIMVIQVYAPTSNAEETEVEWFYEDLQDLLELTPKKDVPFIIGDWNAKSRKARNTWSNRQIWPWSTEWSRAKAHRVLPRERTGHSKHPLSTTQEKTLHMDITRWSTPKSDWLYSLQPKIEKLYTVNKNKTRSWLWLRSWNPYCQIQT